MVANGDFRFSIWLGSFQDDFRGRRLPEIIPGGAIGSGAGWCNWFGKAIAESESDFDGEVPLFGTLAQCLPDLHDSVVDQSFVPGGRWVVGDQGQWIPVQLSMERHHRMIREDSRMAIPSVRGFQSRPSGLGVNAPGFRFPIIEGSWARPLDPIWVRLAGQIVVYEPDGMPLGRLPREMGVSWFLCNWP